MTAIWNVLHTSMRYEIHALYLLIIIMHACLIPIYMIMQYCQLEVYAIFLRMTAVLEMECITYQYEVCNACQMTAVLEWNVLQDACYIFTDIMHASY